MKVEGRQWRKANHHGWKGRPASTENWYFVKNSVAGDPFPFLSPFVPCKHWEQIFSEQTVVVLS